MLDKLLGNMITVRFMERSSDWAYERGFAPLVLTVVIWMMMVPALLIVDAIVAVTKGLIALDKVLSTRSKERRQRRNY